MLQPFNSLYQYKPQQTYICFLGIIDKKNYKILFVKVKLKLAINYLLDNCYFTVATSAFRQKIGITMASNAAPFTVNLFFNKNGF